MKNNNSSRNLPKNILGVTMNPESLESQEVIEKYSSPNAIIGEESVDAVALIYMNPEAILYWLPHFFDYMRCKAKPDSFHFEAILCRLTNLSWVYDIKELATTEERVMINEFIQWLGKQPYTSMAEELGQAQYAYAVQLWK